MSSAIEDKCINKGVRLTEQRKLVAKVMSESEDHPDVDELHKRVNELDYKVVMTGEGSDELFGGYPAFRKDMYTYGVGISN